MDDAGMPSGRGSISEVLAELAEGKSIDELIEKYGAGVVEEALKRVEGALKLTTPLRRTALREKYRVVAVIGLRGIGSGDPLRQVYTLAQVILMAGDMGLRVKRSDTEYAARVVSVASKLLAASMYTGGYGEREDRERGSVGRRFYLDGSVLSELEELGLGEEAVEGLVSHLELLGCRVITSEDGRVIGVYLNEAGFSLLVQTFVSVTHRRLLSIYTSVLEEAIERVKLVLPLEGLMDAALAAVGRR